MEVTVPVSGGGPGFIAGIFGFFGSLINFLFTLAFFIAAGFLLNLIISKLFFRKLISDHLNKDNKVFLLVKVARSSEQKEPAFDEFLRAVHRILPSGTVFSLELASTNQFLSFYIVVPSAYKNVIESQLYAQYPNAEVEAVKDYLPPLETAAFAEIDFKHFSINPIITYHSLKEDILKSFSSLLSKTQPGEQVFFQIVLKRVGSHFWQRGFQALLVKHETPATIKMSQDLYMGKARVIFVAKDKSLAQINLNTVINIFKIAKSPNNELKRKRFKIFPAPILSFKARVFDSGDLWSSSEIATLFHFPYQGSIVSNVVESTTKRAPAPDILPFQGLVNPKDVSFFGETNYRNEKRIFGIKRIDRRRHLYVVGKTGSGKSKLLELLLISDILSGAGCGLLDPHGDLAEEMLKFVPKERIKDVVYINPSDKDYPIGFNPLEPVTDYESRQHLSTFFIAIFKKLFAASWNQRMEHLIRYITLALLETPDSNVMGIPRILSDTSFRQRVIMQIKDPVVKGFWTNEFSASAEQYSKEAVVPIMNKVGQFIANPIVRNMIGQMNNSLNFAKFMDEGKIVLMNISKGKLGDENAALLGALFITKIQQAALERARIPEDERRDFYFYVDEFQNFATEAFSYILSEARKYHLDLTIAHQYIAQLPEDVKATAFGNVGSLISFAVGGDDAAYLSKEFAPTFSANDLISISNREMYIKMSVDGKLTTPFSAKTITVPKPKESFVEEILSHSRLTYGKNRVSVENEIKKWSESVQSTNSNKSNEFPEPII
ncbi:hypothetical protein A3B42_05235 [Candidatus Daviesbacteria bacterium RIFCSPLOWO2_01_FULL_38_10]|nr:MAG: hypothetical protein A3B42_05235 [Candidatus Daviesbacteria bacterium RIFCSPLOWO2_01_FULL_38_10]OGE44261.1 MAG: hypothetical protein A3E67_04555 [Candidatus Daviesbacteria bacterium RIFCSPHIGHO2_12_FULL_38_25]